jgi:hypothetical protein
VECIPAWEFENAGRKAPITMRILLQQKETGLYVKDVGDWTHEPSEAMDFVSSTKAIDFCVAHKIADVQLVLKFEEHLHDIVLPMVTDRRYHAERGRVA